MLQAGTRIADRYELTQPIGSGGMGQVWAGYDERLDRPVAVKFLKPGLVNEADRHAVADRFRREARVTARLDHPGVPTVHDTGVFGDELFIVMQLVPGTLLSYLMDETGPLPVPWVAAIGAQICSVLAAAHAASLVHRDLKPNNLILGPGGLVKVLDFGVAAVLDADMPRLTVTGDLLGTPTYMAPEQALGMSSVGPRADLYALGCILFELLAGNPPYQADNPLGMLHHHLEAPIPHPADGRDDVPSQLDDLVVALLAKDPLKRPESAAAVYARLLQWAAGDVPAGQRGVAPGGADPTSPYRFPFGPLPRDTAPTTRPQNAASGPSSVPSLDELQDVRDQALALADDERFGQAADALATMLRYVAPIYGQRSPEVLEARLDYAGMLVLAGDYRTALPVIEQLITDLRARYGPDHELIRECRQQVATCQAELGEATEALRTLRSLAADDPGPASYPLRHQVALIEGGRGHFREALEVLDSLLRDMQAQPGSEPSDIEDVQAVRDHLSRVALAGGR
ncbi:protein kinase [Paractinoplanes abujensis]|uniref:non-specific serine/threonine protein kinase n=1 Tax=Paractinoplanes abujensis TaxID=882441 RepID=A0A7W7CJV2_9ACTN|nr:serine/threonine-protein kinase [Actinoplanes abujensis]MBB4689911.1 serine/threonine protein kinase [Actinoplanes abujensis]GID24685.1 protein kinase [Actinoplanes abujensis]